MKLFLNYNVMLYVSVTSRRNGVHHRTQLSSFALGQTGLAQGLKVGLQRFINAEKITLQEST